jgi:hypothetical protein
LNAIRTQLQALDLSSAPGFQLNGLKREELIATNSMLLHEIRLVRWRWPDDGAGDDAGT